MRRRNATDAVDDGMYEDAAYRPPDRKLKPWMRCPTCPSCGSACGIGWTQHMAEKTMLRCAACGADWTGTPEQIAQAEAADLAWEKREANEARGPRQFVVRRRRKRGHQDQVSLFSGGKEFL